MVSEKVSIIIVHHNEQDYLKLFLQSIRINSSFNDYEIIIVDNDSEDKVFLSSLKDKDIKVHFNQNTSYSDALQKGLEYVTDSEYLIFSHSDNVVLSKNWLDFLIGLEVDNKHCGAVSIGPLMRYTGPSGKIYDGPHYNFLFTKRNIFNAVKGFQYSQCENVGLILGYQKQLENIGKKMVMISPNGFIHHYSLGKVSQEKKNEDIKKFNRLLVESINKI